MGFLAVPYTGLRFCDCGNEFSQDLKKQEDILFWRAYDFTRERNMSHPYFVMQRMHSTKSDETSH